MSAGSHCPPAATKVRLSRIASGDWPRVLSLLDQALDVPSADRDAWMHQLNVPEALLHTLQRLLAQRAELEAQDFLGSMPRLAPAGAALPPGAAGWTAGSTAGPWRLLRQLGEGGMSVVWLAERADRQMQRTVALKLPHEGAGREGLARRLLRERRILADLEHPHIARLYDVGLTDSGLPYLAMEFVEGQSLLAHADEQRLSLAARVALFQQVLGAVQYAHGHFVLHRDIKPANILVTRGGQVKLLDFGIAKLMAPDGGARLDETDITRGTGHQLTPSYASPEQWMGQALGVVSDVYSLGVVLYELLTDSRPHIEGPAPSVRLQQAVLHDEPVPPSRRKLSRATAALRASTPTDVARYLKGDLDAVCLKALARLPGDRYASADALASDLARWQIGDPVGARSPGSWYCASKFLQRHHLDARLAGASLAALLAMGATTVWQGQAARQEARRATLARDFVLGLFAETSPARLNGARVTSSQMLEHGRQKAMQMAGQPQLQAELLAGIGQTQFEMGDLRAADAALQHAAALFRSSGHTEREAAVLLTRAEMFINEFRSQAAAQSQADLQPLLSAVTNHQALHFSTACWMVQALAAAGDTDATLQPLQPVQLNTGAAVSVPLRCQVTGLDRLAQVGLQAGDAAGARALLTRAGAVVAAALPGTLAAEAAGLAQTQALMTKVAQADKAPPAAQSVQSAQTRTEHATPCSSSGHTAVP